ncbi:MAG: radical SAM protein [Verrucomicrobiota bacterium]
MSVRNCTYPWHWMIVTDRGEVLTCGHGSKPVGSLLKNTADEIWNGETMQEIRASILANRVHPICESTDCPHQQDHLAFTPLEHKPFEDEEVAELFDDAFYLDRYPDVAAAVKRLQFASGFEHFAKHGQREGREYRLVSRGEGQASVAQRNATLALLEHSRQAVKLRSRPADLILQVSTICNLRCVMCPHGTGAVDRPQHMPMEIFERISSYVDTASRMIVSGLGEPFLAPAFWRLIEHCADRDDVFIRANSNAHLVTPESALRVLDSGLKEISFSLDAARPETYAKVRGGDLAKPLRGVEMMCAARRVHPRRSLEIFINMTLMRENVSEAPAFVELAAELGVDAVLFSQLFPFGDTPEWQVERRGGWRFSYSEQMLKYVPDMAREYLDQAKARAIELGVAVVFQSNTHLYLSEPVTEIAAREVVEAVS